MNAVERMLLACLAGLLSGCLDVETVVKVRADGSGTVEERVIMARNTVEMLESLAAMAGTSEPPLDLFAEELSAPKLAERAAELGPGVEVVSAEPLSTEAGEGYRVVFAFSDVNTLAVSQNPDDRAPSAAGVQMQAPPLDEEETPVRFEFRAGTTPELVIRLPRRDLTASAENPGGTTLGASDDANAKTMMEMAKSLLEGLRMEIAVEVEGNIVQTNATYREGPRVTLVEIDFGMLLDDPEKLATLSGRKVESIESMKAIMRDIPGVKVELEPEVRIRFAPIREV